MDSSLRGVGSFVFCLFEVRDLSKSALYGRNQESVHFGICWPFRNFVKLKAIHCERFWMLHQVGGLNLQETIAGEG